MKSCPFCGGQRQFLDSMAIDEVPHFFYVCRSCQCEGPVATDEVGALQAWDQRPV